LTHNLDIGKTKSISAGLSAAWLAFRSRLPEHGCATCKIGMSSNHKKQKPIVALRPCAHQIGYGFDEIFAIRVSRSVISRVDTLNGIMRSAVLAIF
jgi:hypothetical protein